jgi:CheY-like chemotaxis protein
VASLQDGLVGVATALSPALPGHFKFLFHHLFVGLGLILMDMMMPVMDGWEAARALRANPDTKNIPILAATALFRPHELKTCLEAGCNAYIVKPFSFLDLETRIRELLGTSSEQLGLN